MTAFHLAATLAVLAATFGYINHKLLPDVPETVGLTAMALVASLAVLATDALIPGFGLGAMVRDLVLGIDFNRTLMQGMLAFLLFAGALHVNLDELRKERWRVGLMATAGVLISTLVIGAGMHWMIGMPFLVACVLGAIASPTDPVAVMATLKIVKVPHSLEARIAGESLMNDGVGVVVFLVFSALAFGTGAHAEIGVLDGLVLFAKEALGGAAIGAGAGWLTYRALRTVDHHLIELMIVIALAMGSYAMADLVHANGAIATVIAGFITAHFGFRFGMSSNTGKHVRDFWELIDHILNAFLFTLIGFEVFHLASDTKSGVIAALVAIPLALGARWLSVLATIGVFKLRGELERGAITILVWGGQRGGISVALALSLPDSEWKATILHATYAIVIFSILVQGMTIARVIRHVSPERVVPAVPRLAVRPNAAPPGP